MNSLKLTYQWHFNIFFHEVVRLMNNKAIGEGMKLEGCEKRMRILYVRDSVFMSELREGIRIL